MLGKMGDALNQWKMLQELMKDENFRALISHPKVREVFMDPEFQKLVKENNLAKVTSHPRFSSLMSDPEVAQLMLKLKPQAFGNK